jgi:DNA-binding MarR family transcriptional regulator
MVDPTHTDSDQKRIMLGLLDSVARDGARSQRYRASELGIALGLVNAYLKRCIRKGLVKARQAPARRYVYYLTPTGFAEKSRLTLEYLSHSFIFFRHAKNDFTFLFEDARSRGLNRVALVGKSDLAEVAAICALETGIKIIAIIDDSANGIRFLNIPLFRQFEQLAEQPDAVVVTDLNRPRDICEAVIGRFGKGRVLIPELLRLRVDETQEHVA